MPIQNGCYLELKYMCNSAYFDEAKKNVLKRTIEHQKRYP